MTAALKSTSLIDWKSREDQYAVRISAAWSKTIGGILDVGNALIEAKAELRFGHFEHLVKERCPFRWRTANYLMEIARHPVISNSQHAANLPASWATLAELAKFEPRELRLAISNHMFKPDIRRKDIPELHRRVRRGLGIRTRRPARRQSATSSARPPSFAQRFRQRVGPEEYSWISSLDESTAKALAERMAVVVKTFHEEITRGE